jgi:peptidyl-prolyl cis-trans isomerase SurA
LVAQVLRALVLALGVALPGLALAQGNPFAPVLRVGDRVITQYELTQRVLFLGVLNAPGDVTALAMEGLIENRLQQAAADAAGIVVGADAVQAGMEEFAARANLSAEELIAALAPGGVDAETFRDFVEAGITWREVVRQKYAGRIQITEAEIDRAIAAGVAAGGEVRVLLLELVIPTDGNAAAALALANRLRAEIKTEAGFAQAARLHSKSETAALGGRLDWALIDTLPGGVAAQLLALDKGGITEPIQQPGAVVLFYLRDITQGVGEGPVTMQVDYASFQLPPGLTEAMVQARTDRCDDLYPLASGLPEAALQRQTLPEAQLPAGIAASLGALDAGETAMSGGTLLMLCARTPLTEVPPSRDEVRVQLQNRKLSALAAGDLEELRSEAIITTP